MKFILYSILSIGLATTLVTTTQTPLTPVEVLPTINISNVRNNIQHTTSHQLECPHLMSIQYTSSETEDGKPEHCHTCSMGVYVQQFESNEYRCSYCNSLK